MFCFFHLNYSKKDKKKIKEQKMTKKKKFKEEKRNNDQIDSLAYSNALRLVFL
jgi:hypothetical protein